MDTVSITGSVELAGTGLKPLLLVKFGWGVEHATRRMKLTDWMRTFRGAHWSKEDQAWVTPFLGDDPDREMRAAGLYLVSEHGESLAPLTVPVVELDEDERHVVVYPRLMGLEKAQQLVDGAGLWKPSEGALYVPIADVFKGQSPRPGIAWPQRAIELAQQLRQQTTLIDPRLGPVLARMSTAVDMSPEVKSAYLEVLDALGGPVGKPGIDLLPYQKIGALAAAGGHNFIADSPGVGKTFQGLAAMKVRRVQRLLVIAPPVALENWAAEAVRFGTATREQIALIRSGSRKEPVLEGKTLAIISDSLLASRPTTAFALRQWLRGVPAGSAGIVYDEAHRMKTPDSQRTQAVLRLRAGVPGVFPLALTGTPILASPSELVPVLDFTGHLVPVFGSAGAFYTRYCLASRYGTTWAPRKTMLDDLHRRLNDHVWVRRTKAQVLPQLPPRRISGYPVAVSLKDYRDAHTEVLTVIRTWLDGFIRRNHHAPNLTQIREWASGQLSLVTMLRRSAGLAKIDPAIDLLREHLENTPDEPVIVWVHHRDVGMAMTAAANNLGVRVEAISGATSAKDREAIVQAFQRGEVKVLVASITAAGVAITLTRGSRALFVETDWTPSLILQAIDRQHRIGQDNPVEVTVMVALETLDEHIQQRLAEKGTTLQRVLGDDSNSVGVGVVEAREAMTPTDVLAAMVEAEIKRRGPRT